MAVADVQTFYDVLKTKKSNLEAYTNSLDGKLRAEIAKLVAARSTTPIPDYSLIKTDAALQADITAKINEVYDINRPDHPLAKYINSGMSGQDPIMDQMLISMFFGYTTEIVDAIGKDDFASSMESIIVKAQRDRSQQLVQSGSQALIKGTGTGYTTGNIDTWMADKFGLNDASGAFNATKYSMDLLSKSRSQLLGAYMGGAPADQLQQYVSK